MLLPNRQIGMTKFNFKHTPKQKNIKEEIFLLYCDTLLPQESLHHKEPSVCCEAKFCAGKPPRDTQAWRNQWDHPEDIGTWFICSQSKDLPWLYFCRQPLLTSAELAQSIVILSITSPSSCPHSGSTTQTIGTSPSKIRNEIKTQPKQKSSGKQGFS